MSNDKNAIQQTLNATTGAAMTLGQLAGRIVQVDETLRQQAAHAVNCMLTARNWHTHISSSLLKVPTM